MVSAPYVSRPRRHEFRCSLFFVTPVGRLVPGTVCVGGNSLLFVPYPTSGEPYARKSVQSLHVLVLQRCIDKVASAPSFWLPLPEKRAILRSCAVPDPQTGFGAFAAILPGRARTKRVRYLSIPLLREMVVPGGLGEAEPGVLPGSRPGPARGGGDIGNYHLSGEIAIAGCSESSGALNTDRIAEECEGQEERRESEKSEEGRKRGQSDTSGTARAAGAGGTAEPNTPITSVSSQVHAAPIQPDLSADSSMGPEFELSAPQEVPSVLDDIVRQLISVSCEQDRYFLIHLFGGPTYVFFGLPERIAALRTALIDRSGPRPQSTASLSLAVDTDLSSSLAARPPEIRGQDEFSYDLLEPVPDASSDHEEEPPHLTHAQRVAAHYRAEYPKSQLSAVVNGRVPIRFPAEADETSHGTSAYATGDSLYFSQMRRNTVHVHSKSWIPGGLPRPGSSASGRELPQAHRGGHSGHVGHAGQSSSKGSAPHRQGSLPREIRQTFFDSAYPFWAEAYPQVYTPSLQAGLVYRNLLRTNDMPRPRWSEVAAQHYTGDVISFVRARREWSESDLNVEVVSRVSFGISRVGRGTCTDAEARMHDDYAITQVLSRVGGADSSGNSWQSLPSSVMAGLRRNSMEIIGRSEKTLLHGSSLLTARIYTALQSDLPLGLQRSKVRTVTVYERERDGRHMQSLYSAVRAASRSAGQSWKILGRDDASGGFVAPLAVSSADTRSGRGVSAPALTITAVPAAPAALPRVLARCYLILLRVSSGEVVGVFTVVPPLPETTRIVAMPRKSLQKTSAGERRPSTGGAGSARRRASGVASATNVTGPNDGVAVPRVSSESRASKGQGAADTAGSAKFAGKEATTSSQEFSSPGYVASRFQSCSPAPGEPPEDPCPFVFSVSPLGDYISFRATGANENHIMCSSSELMVGSGLGPALYLTEDLRKCQTGRSDTYANEPLFLGEELGFLTSAVVRDIEVRRFEVKN